MTIIRFAAGECSLGSILVAATDAGICAVTLGDDPDALVRHLQDRFPGAALIGGDRDFDLLVAKVVGFVERPLRSADLPVDVRGTAFQRRVWQALLKIPPGKTASYTDIARSIGKPKAARAVAQACAGNQIAVLIPCHRVVRADGSPSGYRWGAERKITLLEREGHHRGWASADETIVSKQKHAGIPARERFLQTALPSALPRSSGDRIGRQTNARLVTTRTNTPVAFPTTARERGYIASARGRAV